MPETRSTPSILLSILGDSPGAAPRSRSPGSPGLPEGDLVGADLSGQDLTGLDLAGADLSRANLSGACLVGANLQGATLFDVQADGAEFAGANLAGANMAKGRFPRAGFGGADLSGASLIETDLEGACLAESNLTGAVLVGASLRATRWREARLSGADFRRADLTGADLTAASLDGARFDDAELEAARLSRVTGFRDASWLGVDARTLDRRGACFLHDFIEDQNFLAEYRRQGPGYEWTYRVWWLTSNCGRSTVRWAACSAVIAFVFALIYTQVGVDYGDHPTPLSPLYFSVVTLTTLGFGDALPATMMAQVVVMVEVVIGYVMLGGLLSLISNKLSRRAS